MGYPIIAPTIILTILIVGGTWGTSNSHIAWIWLIFITSVYGLNKWLEMDRKRSLKKRKSNRSQAPLRLQHEIDSLASFDPKKSHLFFEKIDQLRKEASSYPELKEKLKRKERNASIALLVVKHHTTLERNLRRAVKRDDYGTVLEDNTTQEVVRFLESMGYPYDDEKTGEDYALVIQTLENIRNELFDSGFDVEDAPLDGIEFEHWVSDQLRKFNWNTEVTQPGSDQGIDIIAQYGDSKIGIQCKRFKANVGNKAVQEAYAAKRFFSLDRTIVITTSGCTKSANHLAETHGVGLFTIYDIPNLAEMLGLA